MHFGMDEVGHPRESGNPETNLDFKSCLVLDTESSPE